MTIISQTCSLGAEAMYIMSGISWGAYYQLSKGLFKDEATKVTKESHGNTQPETVFTQPEGISI